MNEIGNRKWIIAIVAIVILIIALFVFKPWESQITSVEIGDQMWMVENLNVTQFANGDIIPEAATTEEWQKAGELGKAAWCNYENDPENGEIYGKLYNWYAVADPRGLAPKGWHVPDNAEWSALTSFLGGEEVAGGKLKAAGTDHWLTPNSEATNESGFTALPGGYRTHLGTFKDLTDYAGWWSSTEYSTTLASSRDINHSYNVLNRYIDSKPAGFSVRCLKN